MRGEAAHGAIPCRADEAGPRSGGMRVDYRFQYPLFATDTSAMNCLLLLRFHLQQSGGYRTDEAASPSFPETIQIALALL